MPPVLSFFVPGRPRPQGSKTAFPIRNRSGQVVGHAVRDASGEEGRAWRSQVRDAAIAAWGEFRPPLEGPLSVAFTFHLLRPLGHFGTGRNADKLKENAPAYPLSPPDALKLARAVEDSLTSIVYRDDSQIVTELILKRYGATYGVQIDIFEDPKAAVALPSARQMQIALHL